MAPFPPSGTITHLDVKEITLEMDFNSILDDKEQVLKHGLILYCRWSKCTDSAPITVGCQIGLGLFRFLLHI